MNKPAYTPKQAAEAIPLISTIKDVQPDKRLFAKAIAEAFINGMQTQERLTAQQSAERPGA